MIKRYCDACDKELVGSDGRMGIEIPCHHLEHDCRGYVDSGGNAISGRTVGKELCNGCSNRIYSKAVMEFRKIREEKGVL